MVREELEHQDGLIEKIVEESIKITPELCANCINHCIKEFRKCLDKEDF